MGRLTKFNQGQAVVVIGGKHSGKKGYIKMAGGMGYVVSFEDDLSYISEENLDFDKQYYLTKFQDEIRARR